MKIWIAVLLIALASVASAQYAPTTNGSTTAQNEINGKLNHQEYLGNPDNVLNCTLGKDLATDISVTPKVLYMCSVTGTPGRWIAVGGSATITGGSCTNQVANAISTTGVPTCVTITSAMVDTSIAKTGVDINTSNQVTATHLAAGLPRAQGGFNNTSPGVGFLRDGTTPTASELGGDCPTSGSFNCALLANKRLRSCIIDNDTQSATALTAAQMSGHCMVGAASHIVEIDLVGGTQIVNGSAAYPTYTGTSSVQIGKYNVGTSSGTLGLMSAAMSMVAGKACALPAAGSATCPILGITQSGAGLNIATVILAAGDKLFTSAATADATQTWGTWIIWYTVD